MGRTQIKTGDIANGAILNEDIAANADISTLKIVGLAAGTTGSFDGGLTVGPSGYLDASNGGAIIRLPQGASTPAASGVSEGSVFWETDVDKLWIQDGSNWKEIGGTAGQLVITLSDQLISTQGTTYAGIMWFQGNLATVFPNNFYMQAVNYQDTSVSGFYRLYNVTDNVLVQELVVAGNLIETTNEGAAIVPTSGSKLYKFEHKKSGGGGTAKTYLAGAILRA